MSVKNLFLAIWNALRAAWAMPPIPTPTPASVEPPAPDPDQIPPDPDDDECVVKDRDGLAPSQTFIWKPVADVGSMAAVVLPAAFSACPPDNPKVTVYFGPEGKKQETGRWNGAFSNGCRMAFRLTRPGRFYGKNVRVVARRADGSTFAWRIPNGAARFEDRYE